MDRRLVVSVTACAVVVVDQLVKLLVISRLALHDVVEVVPGFFNLVHVRNPGAAFSILSDGGMVRTVFLVAVTAAALVVIAFLLRSATDRLTVAALSLVAGGAVGNLIDRLRFGEVVDFLDFHAGPYHWPAFNVADSAITVGVVLALSAHYLGGAESGEERRG
ncbi:MAG TPA: signal peptidase II [Deltaproteobacteria bacterium]|nr:signal peptidase II [Deltaproteobacteria bacterium]